jgi:hypothetical protein
LAIVETPSHFIKLSWKMLCTHTMPRPNDPELEQRECRLNGIRVQIANRVLPKAVIDGFIFSEHTSFFDRLGIGGEIVCHDHINIFGYIFLDVLRQRSRLYMSA